MLLMLLAGCGPNLESGWWVLGEPLPGPELALHTPGCELVFELSVDALGWGETCGRADLPEVARPNGPRDTYRVFLAGDDLGVWMVRRGDHARLGELWVWPPGAKVTDRSTFDAEVVLPLWNVAHGDPRDDAQDTAGLE